MINKKYALMFIFQYIMQFHVNMNRVTHRKNKPLSLRHPVRIRSTRVPSRLSPSDKWRRDGTAGGLDKGSMFFNPLREQSQWKRNVETPEFWMGAWINRIEFSSAVVGRWCFFGVVPFPPHNTVVVVIMTTFSCATLTYVHHFECR